MQPGIQTYQRLAANAASGATVVLATLTGFTFVLQPGKIINVQAVLPFAVGATGGFRFALTLSQTAQEFIAAWEAIDGVTASPGAQVALVSTAQGTDFANAWAVAGNHYANLFASIKGHATNATNISLQWAANTAANSCIVQRGACMIITQL